MKTITEEVIAVTGPMANPPHPGESLREDVLPALDLTIQEAAAQLGVTRQALSAVLNGHAGISVDLAARIEKWLGVEHGGRAEVWLAQQAAYDLARVRRTSSKALKTVRSADHPLMLATAARAFEISTPKRVVAKRKLVRDTSAGRIETYARSPAARKTATAGRARKK
jgi:addiction module HigA family antidote